MKKMKFLLLSMITTLITSGTVVAKALDNQKIAATDDEKPKINIIPDIGFKVKNPIDLYLDSPVELILETEEFYYSGTTVDRIVDIPDENLKSAINSTLGNELNETIQLADLKQLDYLYGGYYEITSLEGLEHATNLKELYLSNNYITDITPLRELENLKHLDLSNNSIQDISILEQEILTSLNYLNLSGNQIENLSSLATSNNLYSLYISDNEISDITPLLNLSNLQSVDLSSNPIEDFSVLSEAKLNNLYDLSLNNSFITDLECLKSLVNLQTLSLNNTRISDYSILKEFENLRYLSLRENQFSNLTELQSLNQLYSLDLSDNQISDLSEIESFTQIYTLNLSNNLLTDINDLGKLDNLQYLYLSDNQISDFSPIGQLDLEYISAENQKIEVDKITIENAQDVRVPNPLINIDGTPMTEFETLVYIQYDSKTNEVILENVKFSKEYIVNFYQPFELSNSSIYMSGSLVIPIEVLNVVDELVDIPDQNLKESINLQLDKEYDSDLYVSDLEQLEYLYASYQDITNLKGLQYAVNLKDLTLSYNQIEDISPLEELKSLENLDLSENFISNLSLIANIENLTSLYLENMSIEDISFLNSLTKLRTVSLSGNKISESKLTNLHLPNLTDLNLSFNNIEDISKLSNLTNLSSLNLSGNKIEDITALKQLDSLTDLNLSNNKIENISELSNLTSLSSLSLSANKISDLSVFSKQGFQSLDHLNLGNNQISDVSPLGNLEGSLTSLSLEYNQISDISFLSKIDSSKLENIDLFENNISDINVLQDLNYNNYPSISLKNQSIFIEEKEIEKGENVSIDNPIKLPDWGELSYDLNDGEYHSDTNQFIWNNLTKNKILTVQFNLDEEYNIPASISYSGKISQRVNVIGGEEDSTLPSIYADDLQIKLGQKVDLLEGVTAFDEQDGNVTQSLQIIDSNVDFTKPGVYQAIYSANNLSGNRVQLERIITIVAKEEDLNQDGMINESDLDLLSDYYHMTSEASKWKESYDLNQDGIIDLYDTVLISNKIQPINITSFEANLSQVILDYIITDEKVNDVTVDLLLNGINVNEISGFVSSTEETQVENEKRHIWNFDDILQSGSHNLKVILKQNGEEIVSQEINIIKNEISPITPLEFIVNNEYIGVSLQLDNLESSTVKVNIQFYVNGIPTQLQGGGGGENGYVEWGGALHNHLLPGENIVGVKINYTVDGVTYIMSLSKYLNK